MNRHYTLSMERFARIAAYGMAAVGLALVVALPIGWMLTW